MAVRIKYLVKELEGSRTDRRRTRKQRLREEEIRRKWKEENQSRGDTGSYRGVSGMHGDRGTNTGNGRGSATQEP